MMFYPTPVEMFNATTAVDEIVVDVGEEVVIPMHDIIFSRNAGYNELLDGAFYDDHVTSNGVISADDRPPGATFAPDGDVVGKPYTLKWTPRPEDIGLSYTVKLRMVGFMQVRPSWMAQWHSEFYDVFQDLTIKVRGGTNYFAVHPAARGESGLRYSAYAFVPEGAEILSAELVDADTDQPPPELPFAGQRLEDVSFQWHGTEAGQYGVTFAIRKIDPLDNGYVPPDQRTWRLKVRYDDSKLDYFGD
jgi:hypothetical protein